jgi:hypothetical protein
MGGEGEVGEKERERGATWERPTWGEESRETRGGVMAFLVAAGVRERMEGVRVCVWFYMLEW